MCIQNYQENWFDYWLSLKNYCRKSHVYQRNSNYCTTETKFQSQHCGTMLCYILLWKCVKMLTNQASCLQNLNNQQKSFSVYIYKELTRKCISKQIRPSSRRWLKTERICELVFTQDIIAHSGPSHNGNKERYCRFQTMVSLCTTPGSLPRRPCSIFHGNGSIRSYY